MSSRGTNPGSSIFPLVIACVLAGVAFWLEQASRPHASGSNGKTRHDPDYMIENFQLRRFDSTGALQHTLTGKHMRHYPDDDSTIVEGPRLIYHRTPTTLVSAREAHVDGEGEHVELIDDVHVIRGGKPGKPDMMIATQHLDVYPDEETATTTVPVAITQGLSNIHGSALKADNKTSIYVLEGPVRGIFFRNGSAMTPAIRTPRPSAQFESKPRPQQKTAQQAKPRPKSQPKIKPQTRPTSKPTSKVAR